MRKIKAGYHKFAQRPKTGLQIKILRRILGNKKTKELIDLYVEEKKKMLLEAFEN